MKKKIGFVGLLGICLLLGSIVYSPKEVFGETQSHLASEDIMAISNEAGHAYSEFYRPKSGIVIDSENGQVLWSDHPDEVLPIASLSKLMTAYIVLDEAGKGNISLDQQVSVSADIAKIAQIYSLSNNKMVTGVEYTVNELLTLMLIPSSNAATVMLSDLISPGNRGAFIDKMNETADLLGMTETAYYNASGASAASFEGLYQPEGYDLKGDNVSTSRDIAILIYNLMKDYPEILNYTKNPVVTVKAGTPYEESFESYVLSIEGNTFSFPGMDGLKTGSSPSAAYGYGGTAQRNGYRLIEVLLGVGTWEEENGEDIRFPIGNALLDKMFASYEKKKVLEKGEQTINDRQITLSEDLYALLKPEQEFNYELTEEGIRVDNGLESVSPDIKPTTVPIQAKSQDFLDLATGGNGQFLSEQVSKNKLLPLVIGLIGCAIVIFNRLVIRRRKQRGAGGTILTTIGIFIGFALVIVAILITVEQLLSYLFV